MKKLTTWAVLIIFLMATACDDDEDPRDAFVGLWEVDVEEECDGYSYEFDDTITISKGSTDNELFFDVDDVTLKATLNGSSITFPVQVIGGDEEFRGNGSFSGASIRVTLFYEDLDSGEECEYQVDGFKR